MLSPPTEEPRDERQDGLEGISLTVWLREGGPNGGQERRTHVREAVAALDETGIETSIRDCPGRVTDPGTGAERAAMDAFDRYRAVAGRRGIRLDPFFDCWTNPDGSRTVVFPVATLVVERDGELMGLYPCEVGGERVTVEDGLAAIESGDIETLWADR
jgi:hypothetical protein